MFEYERVFTYKEQMGEVRNGSWKGNKKNKECKINVIRKEATENRYSGHFVYISFSTLNKSLKKALPGCGSCLHPAVSGKEKLLREEVVT